MAKPHANPEEVSACLAKLSEPELAYIAGLLDGEGCIQAYRTDGTKTRLQVWISNTNRDVLAWLAERLPVGCRINWCKQKSNSKVCGRFCLNGTSAVAFLRTIRKYLIIKAPQADCVLQSKAWDESYRWSSLPPAVDAAREAVDKRLRELKRI